jgi:hypothetical protein
VLKFLAGVLLFDTLPGLLDYEDWHSDIPLLPSVPRFQSAHALPEPPTTYLDAVPFKRRFVAVGLNTEWTVYADHVDGMPLCICLELVFQEWASIINHTEHTLRESIKAQFPFPNDSQIALMATQGTYVRESLDMLQESLCLIQSTRSRGLLNAKSRDAEGTDLFGTDPFAQLEKIAQDLISRTKDHVARYERQLAIVASFIAIEESRTSIRVAQNIG